MGSGEKEKEKGKEKKYSNAHSRQLAHRAKGPSLGEFSSLTDLPTESMTEAERALSRTILYIDIAYCDLIFLYLYLILDEKKEWRAVPQKRRGGGAKREQEQEQEQEKRTENFYGHRA